MMKKTAEAEYFKRTLNTLFNPFEYDDILTPPNASPMSRALHHAGGLALGYGGLAVVLRKLMHYKTQLDSEKTQDKLKSYAAAKYPTLSADPDEDPEKEKEDAAPGVSNAELIRELQQKAATSGMFTAAKPAKNLVKKTLWGSQDPAHLALAAAAAVIGGTAGWKLADYVEDKRRAQELADRVGKAEDDIDKLLYEELQKKNTNQKEANERLSPTNIGANPYRGTPSVSSSPTGEPSLWETLTDPGRLFKGVETLWWLWAVASFALTYKAAKTYGDLKDPNRRRVKQLKEIAKERAKSKEAPVLMDVSQMPTPPKTRDISTEQVQAAPAPKPLPKPPVVTPKQPTQSLAEDMGKKPAVDKDDPYAHLLTT